MRSFKIDRAFCGVRPKNDSPGWRRSRRRRHSAATRGQSIETQSRIPFFVLGRITAPALESQTTCSHKRAKISPLRRQQWNPTAMAAARPKRPRFSDRPTSASQTSCGKGGACAGSSCARQALKTRHDPFRDLRTDGRKCCNPESPSPVVPAGSPS